ncbi:sulfotransferase [Caulobacter sp. 17J80-11]|uniref:sulfotransferase family protein n=1 Tax=Caulobacter sp. 17J80-11 TaxID=2763502 RepID=UPI0016538610|nr:sulfotransferase [Caulobacter sp. 17J80-11]
MQIQDNLTRIVGRQALVRAAADEMARLNARDPNVMNRIGTAYSQIGAHDTALPFYRAAAELAPRHAASFYNLGSAQQFTGDFAGARASFLRAVTIDANLYQAWLSLVQLRRQSVDDNHLERLEALFAGPDDADGDRSLHLGHALAKTFEDLGDERAAFGWLGRAKAKRGRMAAYDAAGEAETFAAARATWDGKPSAGFGSTEPIFVFGLPRTGTTLVDRILAAHPDVTSVGELATFPPLVAALAGGGGRMLDPANFARAAGIDFEQLGRLYIESARPAAGATPRFVDKTPIDILFAGLILKALPNARLVCLRRDPMDSVLSYYRQIFFNRRHPYPSVYDLRNAARHYARFHHLADHWRGVLPADRYLELGYEALIADQAGETRRLLDFCGLGWDDRCLEFHKAEGVVATPSAVQVRSPLHPGSIGRWRRYGELLEPALEVLREEGVAVAA